MELNDKEKKKFTTIQQLINGEISRKDARNILGLSSKQITRLIKVFNEHGENGFIHKNRGKLSKNKKDLNIIEEIKKLYLSEYFDYTFEAFYEEIENKYNISYNTMYKIFLKDDIVSPIAHKETMKLYNERMEKATTNNDANNTSDDILNSKIELFKTRKLEQEKAFIRRSSNLLAFGQEVQMDASSKLWFGNIVSFLHLAVDKATKKVLFGWFEYEELTRGYFVILYHILLNYGIPYKIKTDNRSSFSTNRKDKNKFNVTQFGKICEFLGIFLETSSNPVSKANVERENGTFKNRLIAELRHENINEIDKANEYLNKVFIPKMNKKFSYDINEKNTMMKKNDYTNDDLNLIISERYTRLIDNASSISFHGKYYAPYDFDTGEIMTYKHRTECTVIIAYDGTYWCEIEKKYFRLFEIPKRENINNTIDEEQTATATKQKYIPPANHPWRKDMKKFFNKK